MEEMEGALLRFLHVVHETEPTTSCWYMENSTHLLTIETSLKWIIYNYIYLHRFWLCFCKVNANSSSYSMYSSHYSPSELGRYYSLISLKVGACSV